MIYNLYGGFIISDIEIIKEAIKYIIKNKQNIVDIAYSSNGGWKKWLQVEIYAYLIGERFDINREVPYPLGLLYGDLVLNNNTLCELKTDYNNYENVLPEFNADINKISKWYNNNAYAILISKRTFLGNGFEIDNIETTLILSQ